MNAISNQFLLSPSLLNESVGIQGRGLESITSFALPNSNASISYGFTISGNTVSAMSISKGTNSHTLKLPSNATFNASSDGGVQSVTETLNNNNGTEVIVYKALSSGSNSFVITSDTLNVTTPSVSNGSLVMGVSFNSVNGVITGMTENTTYKGKTSTHLIYSDSDSVFVKNSDGSVTQTFVEGNSIIATKYVQPSTNNSSSLYAVASTQTTYVSVGTAKTNLSVNPDNQLILTLTGNSVTGVQTLSSNGVKTSVNLPSSITFQEVTAGKTNLIEELITHNSNTSFILYLQSGTGSTYTEIAHGAGSSIDLVGIQAQLNQIPSAVLALL